MSLLKKLFGGTSVNFAELVKQGAMIIDVRSPAEYKGGHIKGSVNIPLQSLQASLSKVPKNKAIITCCASGMRSGSAKSILKAAGYNVHNGGGWMSLKSKIKKLIFIKKGDQWSPFLLDLNYLLFSIIYNNTFSIKCARSLPLTLCGCIGYTK